MAIVLLVDDEPNVHQTFEDAMEAGLTVLHARDGMQALDLLAREDVDLLVTDLTMPHLDGLALLREVRSRGLRLPALVLSAHGSVPNVVEALNLGAHDFVEKPASTDRLRLAVAGALAAGRRDTERRELLLRAGVSPSALADMVGESGPMVELVERIGIVAPKKARVLISGENGTGKELVARALHEQSGRAGGPFIRVNCAAIPETLFESELFGHEKGAFTGATSRHAGRFERADHGTLFLDEIGEMPLALQPKLLRAIEAGEVERVGGGTLAVDVRVVAATNRNLEAMVATGEFREDLFYRLNVVPLRVPPLRERRGDIAALAQHFVAWACHEESRPHLRLGEEAVAKLEAHAWPGNVRELRNLIERLVIFASGEELTASEVAEALPGGGTVPGADGSLFRSELPLRDVVAEAERLAISHRLERYEGNKTRAAESLGLERSHLYKKMKALGLVGES